MNDFNAQVIEEFRANQGRVGGGFEGAPMVLVHHVGRKSGDAHVSPMMYLVAAGSTEIEVGAEKYAVDVAEETGEDRDRIYAEQAALYPGFAEYAEKTAGIRVIPVLRLTRR
jgi:hypothetical protein